MASQFSNIFQSIPKKPPFTSIGLILLCGFVLFNLVGFLVFSLRLYHFFRTILILYLTNVIVFPAIFLLAVIFRRMSARSWRLGTQDWMLLLVTAILFLVFVYASWFEPSRPQIERIEILSTKVSAPFTILHISDIQSGVIGRYEERVFQQIRALQPDIIIHTGDLLQSYFFTDAHQEQAKMARLFRSLNPPFGVYNVIGDVDQWLKSGAFDRMAGFRTLQNELQTIAIRGMPVRLLGLSQSSARHGDRELIEQWLARGGSDTFFVLFGHAPDYVLDIQDLKIDLCLAGHTHGGQIRLPGIGPLVTLSRVPKTWAMGFRKLEHLRLNVSAGIGAEHASQLPPIRVNCPPTMTVFIIRPVQDDRTL